MTTTHALYPHHDLPLAPDLNQGRRSSDFLAPLVGLLGFIVLIPFTKLDPYPATAVIGAGTVLTIALALRVKYRGRLTLNLEITFVLGAILQYVFAPTLIRVLLDDFAGAGMSAERWAVKEVYGEAMLITLLFLTSYLAISAFFPIRTPPRLSDGRINVLYSQRTVLVMAVMAVMLWMTRAALLASGSYYHINRTRFMYDDPRYSGWAQFDNGVGPLLISFLWGAMLLKKIPAPIVIGYTLVDLVWNFASGSRERTVIPFIVIGLTYVIYRNRIPWRAIAVLLIPFVFLIGFMDYYRYAIRRTTDATSLTVGGVVDALSRAQHESETSGFQSVLYRGLSRVNDIEPIAAIYFGTGVTQPYLKGETYARIPEALIPRALWPDKPKVITPINEWFFRRDGGSSPITTMGEGYLNYGWIGVVISGMACALMVRLSDWLLLRHMWNVAVLPVFIAALAIFARLHTQSLAVWVTTIIKMFFLVWGIHLLTRPGRHVPTATSTDAGPGDHPYATAAGHNGPYN